MNDWPSVRLGALTNEVLRRNTSRQVVDVFSVTNVDGFTPSEEVFSKRVHSRDIANYKVVHTGEFAYNPSRVNVGSIDYLHREDPVVISPMYVVFEIDDDLLDKDYLLYFLTGELGLAWINHMTAGSVRDTLKFSDLCRIEIPLPALLEQRRITDILRRVSKLNQLRRRANKRASDLLPTLFYDLFGDPVANRHGWSTRPLHQFGEIATGNTPPRSHPEYYGDYIDWVKSDDLGSVTGIIGPTAERLSDEGARRGRVVPRGSTLVTCIAGSLDSIGKTGLADRAVAFNQQINAITPNPDTNPHFLYALITVSQPLIQAKSTKGMKKIINKGRFETVQLVAPPREEQDRFAQQWLASVAYLNLQEEAALRFATLSSSLLARAFTGELTAIWRATYKEELAEGVVERDRLLALRIGEPYTLDPDTGQVVALNQRMLARLVTQQMEPAVRQFQEALAENQFVEIAAQLAWLSLAELIQPLAPEYAETLSRILSESVANLHRDALSELGQAAGALAESTKASLAEAALESVNVLSLALARDVAVMAAQIWATLETPSLQAGRAARASLDMLTLSVLRSAEGQSAYFQAEDLAHDGIGLVEAEEHLRLLAALGFVRHVEVRGKLLYRAVDPIAERALPEGLEV